MIEFSRPRKSWNSSIHCWLKRVLIEKMSTVWRRKMSGTIKMVYIVRVILFTCAEICMRSDKHFATAMLATNHISTEPSQRSVSAACSWSSSFSTMTSLAFFILFLTVTFTVSSISVWFPTPSSSSQSMSCPSWPSLFTLSAPLTTLSGFLIQGKHKP